LNQTQKINTENLIITANLPYIKNWDFENMDKEVLENEPHIALFGWEETGFELYEKLIFQIFELKNIYSLEKITLFIEIWFDQREYSQKYLESLWLEIEYFKDLWWIDRIVKICF
jgi:release factor glutamine methyltransferase